MPEDLDSNSQVAVMIILYIPSSTRESYSGGGNYFNTDTDEEDSCNNPELKLQFKNWKRM